MSFLPWDDGEASLAETLVDQAVLPERPEPAIPQEVQCFLAEVLSQMSCMYAMCSVKGAKWARSRSAHFPRIWSSSARWVVGSISLIFPGLQCRHFRSSGCWSGGGSSRENHLSWSWRSHSFSSGEKFSLSLPSAAAMRRSHRLSQRLARSPADKGWGSLPAADATEVVRRYYLVRLAHRNAREFQELSESEGWLPAAASPPLPCHGAGTSGPAAPRLSVSGR